MRKRNVKKELLIYPMFMYENGRLKRIETPTKWDGYVLHHYITTQWEQEHPKLYPLVKHLQKLILLPAQMHIELHGRHSKFKEKYGIEIDELLFDWRKDMISAKTARAKSEQNGIKLKLEYVEKQIKKAVDNGRNEIFVMGELHKDVTDELDKAGYTYDKQVNGYKIWW